MSPPPRLQIGFVSKAHGLRGEVLVRTFDPSSEALYDVPRAVLRSREGTERIVTLDGIRGEGAELIVAFAEVHTRTEAEGLVGSTVLVFREDLEAPAEGEYFQGDLVGLAAVDGEGNALGVVEEIWTTGEVPTLVIRGGREELLVPFADEFVGEVDVAQGRIVVRPPEYTE